MKIWCEADYNTYESGSSSVEYVSTASVKCLEKIQAFDTDVEETFPQFLNYLSQYKLIYSNYMKRLPTLVLGHLYS